MLGCKNVAPMCSRRIKLQLNKSRQRRVWNPQLVAVWNQTVGLYGINPKENAPAVMPYACGDYILAHTRLHANPSDWIEKSKSFDLLFSWLPLLGNEDKNN